MSIVSTPSNTSSGLLSLFITSSDTHSERRFPRSLTLSQLRAKLEPITGIPASAQRLTLLPDADAQAGAPLAGVEELTLEQAGVRELMTIRVEDSTGASGPAGQWTDVSQVEKYEMADEEYSKRRDTVLAYKRAHSLGRFASPSPASTASAPTPTSDIPLGARCEVAPDSAGALTRRGTVRFVGPTQFGTRTAVWVGVEWDEPVGRNDGSVEGVRYFECKDKFGAFVRPERVTVGDFPVEEDWDEELEEM